MTNEDLQQIQNLVAGARRVLILTHTNPSVDTMASTLALYLAMAKMGKDVTVAMESQPLVEVANLVGIDQVKTSLAGKNLLLTYKPYNLGDFEKVTYLEDQGQAGTLDDAFKLTITPREGYAPDPKNFTFSFTGAAADLIFTVEVLEPTQLGQLYDANLLASTPIINIDNHDPNKDYGKFNLVEPDAASISEIVTFFLRAVNAQIDTDIAGNLYQGIRAATQNFQSPKVAAATFEAAAICLRSAKPKTAPQQPAVQPNMNQVPPTQANPVQPQNILNTNNQQPASSNQGVPSDWLGPKSYKGTSVS
ncbi:DHH family phosphoesterase [Patescibacteria group bacterium]|nr:DHH family phosphoesterase [Patescibacteria group bacterium]